MDGGQIFPEFFKGILCDIYFDLIGLKIGCFEEKYANAFGQSLRAKNKCALSKMSIVKADKKHIFCLLLKFDCNVFFKSIEQENIERRYCKFVIDQSIIISHLYACIPIDLQKSIKSANFLSFGII
jgi:hypothetical protein